ncbi:MAG: hypothetical protein CYG60_06350 [Actinobacteria bacterium]|nr:MAG: hypothetical protein CYG60_06350 [Actinomycetota bacterium]
MSATEEARSARREGEGRPLRLLLVEDSPDDALFVLRELRRGGYRVSHERVETAGDMLAALKGGGEWDLVISDHAMPRFSAPAALELLRYGGWPDLPFIIVSGHIGEDAAVKIMKAGAQDYVPKDNLARLAPAVERELGDAEERRQRRHAQEALKTAEEKYRGIFENAVEGIFQTTSEGRLMTVNPMMARILGYDSPEEMAEKVRDIGRQLYVEPARREEFARRMEEEGRVFEFEALFYRKDGSVIWASMNARAVRSASGEVVGFEGTLEDITERKEAEAELRRSLDRLMALHEAGIILGSTLEPEEIGTRLLEIMRRISGLTAAAISLRGGEDPVEVWRSIGLEEPGLRIRKTPEVKQAIEAALHGEVTQVFSLAAPESGFATGICLPLMVRERAVGVLEAYGPAELAEGGTVSIFESLTGQAARALENARLYGELAQREKKLQELVGKILVAQEEERRRVAYEVHDGLAQVAAAAHQHLQAFAHFHPPATNEGREDLDRAAKLVRQTVGEARRVIADLRPTALDEFGLPSAIRLHLDALRADGWRIAYEDALGDERLPAATETAIFRVVQEALNNVGKHAGTTRVDISLVRRPTGPLGPGERGAIRLRIRDYGRGFVPADGSGGGPGERVGMAGMRERITLLGGVFRVASRPGVGTLVLAEIPLLGDPAGKTVADVLLRPATGKEPDLNAG